MSGEIYISVIIPVYNGERFIRRSVDSILNQQENLELILVDDGSQDGSLQICNDYAKKYENVYVVHQKNQGVCFARNAGIDIAKGEYIAFCDADDYISGGHLLLL